MSLEGFVECKSREFCNDVKCPVQMELSKLEAGSEKYEGLRQSCRTNCRYTAWRFHHWLMEKGYLILKPKGLGGK